MTEFQEKMIKKLRKIRELSNAEFTNDAHNLRTHRYDENLSIVISRTFVMFKVLDGASIFGDDIEFVGNEIWFYQDKQVVSMIPYHVFFGRGA